MQRHPVTPRGHQSSRRSAAQTLTVRPGPSRRVLCQKVTAGASHPLVPVALSRARAVGGPELNAPARRRVSQAAVTKPLPGPAPRLHRFHYLQLPTSNVMTSLFLLPKGSNFHFRQRVSYTPFGNQGQPRPPRPARAGAGRGSPPGRSAVAPARHSGLGCVSLNAGKDPILRVSPSPWDNASQEAPSQRDGSPGG